MSKVEVVTVTITFAVLAVMPLIIWLAFRIAASRERKEQGQQ